MRLSKNFCQITLAGLVGLLATIGVSASTDQASAVQAIQGDANCSGTVDASDIASVLKHASGLGVAPCAANADVNCDLSVDAADALQILLVSAGLPANPVSDCPAIGGDMSVPPSQPAPSDDLIQQALANGDIDSQTALVYETFAAFGDNRLPSQYQQQNDTFTDVGMALSYQFDSLSPENQALVKPYLTPPGYQGSWLGPDTISSALPAAGPNRPPAPPGGFKGIPSSDGHAVVWWQNRYPGDQATAQRVADSIANDTWNRLTGLMGHVPVSDANEQNNGGDAKLDFYLVDMKDFGITTSYSSAPDHPGLRPSPVFIQLNRQALETGTTHGPIESIAGHELFHAIQAAYNIASSFADSNWMWEATAKWSEDYLFPSNNAEHHYADLYFISTARPLEQQCRTRTNHGRCDDPDYEAYIFFYFLSKTYGDAIIPQIFSALSTKSPLAALDAVIPGGFDSAWSQFAVHTLNLPPYDQFKQWDSLTSRISGITAPDQGGTVEVTANNQTFRPVFQDLQPRSIQAYHLNFSQLAGTSALITLLHPNGAMPSGLHVWLATIVGGKPPQFTEWTDAASKGYCLSQPGEQLDEAWVIIANSSSGNVPLPSDIMEASPTCGWSGDATSTRTFSNLDGTTFTETIHATNLRFVETNVAGRFATVAGQLTETVSGVYLPTGGDCMASGSFSHDVGAGKGQLHITTEDPVHVTYSATGSTPFAIEFTFDCHGNIFDIHEPAIDWLNTGPSDQASSDPKMLDGTYQIVGNDATTTTYQWHLTRVTGPSG